MGKAMKLCLPTIRPITMTERRFTCQECGGIGGWRDIILDDGTGPWEVCGYCNGTGKVTAQIRGEWLTLKRLAP